MPISKSINGFFRRLLIHIGGLFNIFTNCCTNCCSVKHNDDNLHFDNPNNNKYFIGFTNPIFVLQSEEYQNNKYDYDYDYNYDSYDNIIYDTIN